MAEGITGPEGTITGAEGTDIMSEWWEDFLDWNDQYNPFNLHRGTRKIEKLTQHQIEVLPSKLDDPSEFDTLYDDPIAGTIGRSLLDWYKDKKIKEDAKRYYDDYEKNTGQTYRNSKYKWKDYYEKGLGRYSGLGGTSELFEASSSVINQFNRRLYKW